MRLLDPSARVAKRLTRIGGVLIDMPSARDKAGRTHALARLRRDPAVEAAEPNFIYYLSAGMPNDPLAPQQWHLRAVKAMEAWSHAAGGREVVVAVMDTGVQLFHEDLRGRIWTNPKEIPDNGLDDDGNGFVDDIHGWNFVQGHNNPTAELVPLPQEGCLPDEASRGYEDHGTHVAGIIGATTGNGRGIAGLAPNVKIMSLKIMGGPCGIGRLVDVVLALDYAIANGAHIVNMSIGGPNRSAIMQKLLEAAGRKGILVVAAAGNAASDNDVVPEFPSGYPLPNIISVAATGVDDELADFSNFGPRSVHLAAPGVDILSSVPEGEDGRGPDSGYKAHTGTSMAVPVVVGAAALIKSQHPDMTGAQIRERLLETVDRVAGLAGKVAAGGRFERGPGGGRPDAEQDRRTAAPQAGARESRRRPARHRRCPCRQGARNRGQADPARRQPDRQGHVLSRRHGNSSLTVEKVRLARRAVASLLAVAMLAPTLPSVAAPEPKKTAPAASEPINIPDPEIVEAMAAEVLKALRRRTDRPADVTESSLWFEPAAPVPGADDRVRRKIALWPFWKRDDLPVDRAFARVLGYRLRATVVNGAGPRHRVVTRDELQRLEHEIDDFNRLEVTAEKTNQLIRAAGADILIVTNLVPLSDNQLLISMAAQDVWTGQTLGEATPRAMRYNFDIARGMGLDEAVRRAAADVLGTIPDLRVVRPQGVRFQDTDVQTPFGRWFSRRFVAELQRAAARRVGRAPVREAPARMRPDAVERRGLGLKGGNPDSLMAEESAGDYVFKGAYWLLGDHVDLNLAFVDAGGGIQRW